MRWTFLGLIVAAGGVGCSSSGHSITPAQDTSPSCTTVAQHLVELAERDNAAHASTPLATGIHAEAVRQCTELPWSIGRRDCLFRATTQDATLGCPPS